MTDNILNQVSPKVLSRFVKDFNLTIQVSRAEYIMYYLNLYNDVYNSLHYYNLFEDLYQNVGGTNEAFMSASYKVVDGAIEIVKNNPAYKAFLADTSDMFCRRKEDWVLQDIPTRSVYKGSSEGKNFLSIDLRKGNYSALRYYSQEIKHEEDTPDNLILGSHNFDEFISLFTKHDYFKESKHLRQVIFGNMNPKRQVTIEKFMIDKLAEKIFEKGIFTKEDIYGTSHDEIVFNLKDECPIADVDTDDILVALQQVADELHIDVHFDIFTIKQIKPLDSFIKIKKDGSIEFKCVDSSLMPQVYKHVIGTKELCKEDLMFTATNGLLAYFAEPIKFE